MTLSLVTSGESHGPALVAIVTGLPAGLQLDRGSIDADLRRRQQGYGRSPRQKLETDEVEVLAGLRHGATLGTPLALVVRNRDHANWSWGMSPWLPDGESAGKGTKPVTLPRPGHADLAGVLKFGHDDVRNALERASARHTAVHVAAGAVAKVLIGEIGIVVEGRPVEVGGATGDDAMRAATDAARADRDTLGGIVEVVATGVPPGLGSYAEKGDRLDARLAAATMGIQAVKGVEIGDGFALARTRGSEAHDEIGVGRARATNRAGGLEAGVSNGEAIVVRAAMKPLPTLMRPLGSVDLVTGEAGQALVERSDVQAVEALAVVAECAVAWELARAAKEKFGGDAVADFVAAYRAYADPDQLATHLNALGRHLALIGFMGAGKTTTGARVAERLERPFVDLDTEIETRAGRSIEEIFDIDGEPVFRALEEGIASDILARSDPHVIAIGGGATASPLTRENLARHAFSVLLDVSPADAWSRATGAGRPLARDEIAFRALYEERAPIYELVADARARDEDGVLLGAGGVVVDPGALELLSELVPGDGPVELVTDSNVAGIHGIAAQLALGVRDSVGHEVPPGEAAKTVAVLERLWRSFRLGRDGTIVGLGGGCTTDVAGFSAATYMRGVSWVAVPTTLVGQVDAGIGGKTAVDLPAGKNLIGAFHWPARVVIDPGLLETLPDTELENGRAEVVKTGLLAGRPLWELAIREQVRAAAAFKTAICLADPHDLGARQQLNLGHTFAHALEAAAGYDLPHGRAVALGMLAALRLSGNTDAVATVESVLRPERVAVDADLAWAALARDKKARDGSPRLVLLEPGRGPSWGREVPATDVRRALDELIA